MNSTQNADRVEVTGSGLTMKTKTSRRSRGTGAIFKRNGKFVYQWKCVTGKIKTKTLNAITREEAEKEIESIQQEEIKLSAIDSKISYMHQIASSMTRQMNPT